MLLRARPVPMTSDYYSRIVIELAMNGAESARFISHLHREGVKPELDAQGAVGTD